MEKQGKLPKFHRILLKVSGEALGKDGTGIDSSVVKHIAAEIKPVLALGVEIGMIIGGGNFFRGRFIKAGIKRITVDQMGMLATILNALAIRDIFEHEKIPTTIMSALPVTGIVHAYEQCLASKILAEHKLVIFAGGTGNPLVTTDTALCLRGVELDADLLIKATNVDGIFSSDPSVNKQAKLYSRLTYDEALEKELAVMDLAAFCLCRDHCKRLRVFNMMKPGALLRIVLGEDEGTLVE